MPVINRACNIMNVSFTCLFSTRPCPLHGVRRHLPIFKPFFWVLFFWVRDNIASFYHWNDGIRSAVWSAFFARVKPEWLFDCASWSSGCFLRSFFLFSTFYRSSVPYVKPEWALSEKWNVGWKKQQLMDTYGETEPDETVSWLKTIVVSQREQTWKAEFAEDSTLISE